MVGSDDDGLDQVCPAFSPNGARLASGQSTGDEQSGWRDAALLITDLDPEGEPGASRTIPLDGMDRPPCPIWAPDGRWVAFGAEAEPPGSWGVSAEVLVVDTSTGEIRRLTGLAATDIEWAQDGSQLYIADESGILATRSPKPKPAFSGTPQAPSPSPPRRMDTLAVERRTAESSEFARAIDLWLMSADGDDRRILIEDYTTGGASARYGRPTEAASSCSARATAPARSTGEYPHPRRER